MVVHISLELDRVDGGFGWGRVAGDRRCGQVFADADVRVAIRLGAALTSAGDFRSLGLHPTASGIRSLWASSMVHRLELGRPHTG